MLPQARPLPGHPMTAKQTAPRAQRGVGARTAFNRQALIDFDLEPVGGDGE